MASPTAGGRLPPKCYQDCDLVLSVMQHVGRATDACIYYSRFLNDCRACITSERGTSAATLVDVDFAQFAAYCATASSASSATSPASVPATATQNSSADARRSSSPVEGNGAEPKAWIAGPILAAALLIAAALVYLWWRRRKRSKTWSTGAPYEKPELHADSAAKPVGESRSQGVYELPGSTAEDPVEMSANEVPAAELMEEGSCPDARASRLAREGDGNE